MGTASSAEAVRSFDLAGYPGPVRVEIEGGAIRIARGKKKVLIPGNALLGIHHIPCSWRTGRSVPSLRIRFDHGRPEHPQKTQIALAADDSVLPVFLDALAERFPAQFRLGPDESEKTRILSAGHLGCYGLHALHILTPSGIVTAMLIVFALILSLILAESMPARSVGDETLRAAQRVLLGMALIPAAVMALVLAKRLMVLRTDERGLTVRRLFGRLRVLWREVEVAEPRSDAFKVYRGLFCCDSDRVEVVSSRCLAEIPLLRAGMRVTTVRMPLEEAGPFFRELYYRGKVTRETAEAFGGFIPRLPAGSCPRAPQAV